MLITLKHMYLLLKTIKISVNLRFCVSTQEISFQTDHAYLHQMTKVWIWQL